MSNRIMSGKFCFLSENTEDNLKNENEHKNDKDLKNHKNLKQFLIEMLSLIIT